MTTPVEAIALRVTEWMALTPRERAAHLGRLRRVILERREEIAVAVAADTGRPEFEVLTQEVAATLEMIRTAERRYPQWLQHERIRYLRPGFARKRTVLLYEPIGTVAVIGPRNFPFSLPMMQTSVALACGNCVVLKPSEHAPATAGVIVSLFDEVGMLGDTVRVELGGPETVDRLITDSEVAKVFFTGSESAGRRVAAMCGAAFKPCVLELGGAGVAIVLEDADVQMAARGILWSAVYAAGDSCVGTRHVYAQHRVAAQLGHALHRRVGELTSRDTGSQHPIAPEPPAVIPFDELREAIDGAREVGDGLSASVWTSRRHRGEAVARVLDAGMVWVNDCAAGQPQFPWEGRGASGWGRIYGRQGMLELVRTKVISIDRQQRRPRSWWFPYTLSKRELVTAALETAFGRIRLRTLTTMVNAWWRVRSGR
jgi:acyl-CoA reductase-like NAD-dependent aldehyde dehydrogenase